MIYGGIIVGCLKIYYTEVKISKNLWKSKGKTKEETCESNKS